MTNQTSSLLSASIIATAEVRGCPRSYRLGRSVTAVKGATSGWSGCPLGEGQFLQALRTFETSQGSYIVIRTSLSPKSRIPATSRRQPDRRTVRHSKTAHRPVLKRLGDIGLRALRKTSAIQIANWPDVARPRRRRPCTLRHARRGSRCGIGPFVQERSTLHFASNEARRKAPRVKDVCQVIVELTGVPVVNYRAAGRLQP